MLNWNESKTVSVYSHLSEYYSRAAAGSDQLRTVFNAVETINAKFKFMKPDHTDSV